MSDPADSKGKAAKKERPVPKTCFVISPIGSPGTDTRKRADQVLTYILEAVMQPMAYTVVRADKIADPGTISLQIVQQVLGADLVVADLTGRNPNVYYELAIRHAARKPFIHLIDASEQLPFDVQDFRAIPFDVHDLDSVAEAKAALRSQVEAIESGVRIETPLTRALELKALDQSDDPQEQVLADLVREVAGLRQDLRSVVAERTRLVPWPARLDAQTASRLHNMKNAVLPSLPPGWAFLGADPDPHRERSFNWKFQTQAGETVELLADDAGILLAMIQDRDRASAPAATATPTEINLGGATQNTPGDSNS